MRRLHVVALVMAVARCGRGGHPPVDGTGGASTTRAAASPSAGSPSSGSPSSASASGIGTAARAPARMPDESELSADLWRRAGEGEADDLARLADREGPSGLVEKATPATRLTALRALAFADGVSALPFLAEAAGGTDEAEAAAALESLAAIATRPRRAVDPEDAAELREGCDAILALAKDTARARARRAPAVRFLRLMEGRGCVPGAAIPTDVDVPPR